MSQHLWIMCITGLATYYLTRGPVLYFHRDDVEYYKPQLLSCGENLCAKAMRFSWSFVLLNDNWSQ